MFSLTFPILIFSLLTFFKLIPKFGVCIFLDSKYELNLDNKSTSIETSKNLNDFIKNKFNNYHNSTLNNISQKINLNKLNRTYCELFGEPRNHGDQFLKNKFQIKLKNILNSFGYETNEQLFRLRYSNTNLNNIEHQIGKNIIVQLNGKFSLESKNLQKYFLHQVINLKKEESFEKKFHNKNLSIIFNDENFTSKQKDKLIVIGAHYDTVFNVSGIEDNASGSIVLLELARLLVNYKHKLDYTILFVWFDFEESGALGSMAFVNHYLIPNYLQKDNQTFLGAYILDMLLNYDENENFQSLPIEIVQNLKNSLNSLNEHYLKENFLFVWHRKNIDTILIHNLNNAIENNQHSIKFLPIDFAISNYKLNQTHLYKYRYFFRGDHSSFWLSSKNNEKYAISAVLITNMAYWRESHSKCYHKQCDDISQLTEQNLNSLINTIYMIKDAIVRFQI